MNVCCDSVFNCFRNNLFILPIEQSSRIPLQTKPTHNFQTSRDRHELPKSTDQKICYIKNILPPRYDSDFLFFPSAIQKRNSADGIFETVEV